MKMLLSTTALVLALGLPTLTLAQTTSSTKNTTTMEQTETKGFLGTRGQSDIYASELIGNDVYARRTPADANANQGAATNDGSNTLSTMNRTDLDGMDNIGQINEIIMSSDGQVRAIVIGVGGFLGMGEQDVAVTMDQVAISSSADDRSELYVVVNTDAKMLKDSPRYDRTSMSQPAKTETDAAQAVPASKTDTQAKMDKTEAAQTAPASSDTNAADRTAFVAPSVTRGGYKQIEVKEVSSEMLVGESVYGVNDKSIGTIDDLILDDKGAITNVVIDFGGFLGVGASQVSVNYDELTILSTEGNDTVRVYVDATKEQVQAQPKYNPAN